MPSYSPKPVAIQQFASTFVMPFSLILLRASRLPSHARLPNARKHTPPYQSTHVVHIASAAKTKETRPKAGGRTSNGHEELNGEVTLINRRTALQPKNPCVSLSMPDRSASNKPSLQSTQSSADETSPTVEPLPETDVNPMRFMCKLKAHIFNSTRPKPPFMRSTRCMKKKTSREESCRKGNSLCSSKRRMRCLVCSPFRFIGFCRSPCPVLLAVGMAVCTARHISGVPKSIVPLGSFDTIARFDDHGVQVCFADYPLSEAAQRARTLVSVEAP